MSETGNQDQMDWSLIPESPPFRPFRLEHSPSPDVVRGGLLYDLLTGEQSNTDLDGLNQAIGGSSDTHAITTHDSGNYVDNTPDNSIEQHSFSESNVSSGAFGYNIGCEKNSYTTEDGEVHHVVNSSSESDHGYDKNSRAIKGNEMHKVVNSNVRSGPGNDKVGRAIKGSEINSVVNSDIRDGHGYGQNSHASRGNEVNNDRKEVAPNVAPSVAPWNTGKPEYRPRTDLVSPPINQEPIGSHRNSIKVSVNNVNPVYPVTFPCGTMPRNVNGDPYLPGYGSYNDHGPTYSLAETRLPAPYPVPLPRYQVPSQGYYTPQYVQNYGMQPQYQWGPIPQPHVQPRPMVNYGPMTFGVRPAFGPFSHPPPGWAPGNGAPTHRDDIPLECDQRGTITKTEKDCVACGYNSGESALSMAIHTVIHRGSAPNIFPEYVHPRPRTIRVPGPLMIRLDPTPATNPEIQWDGEKRNKSSKRGHPDLVSSKFPDNHK